MCELKWIKLILTMDNLNDTAYDISTLVQE